MTDLTPLLNLTPDELEAVKELGKNQGTQDPQDLPGRPQVWKVGPKTYVVYYIPGTKTPLVWEGTNEEVARRFSDVGASPSVDRNLSEAEFQALTPWLAGRIDEIRNPAEDPWTQFWSDYNEAAELRPWLRDPDMLAVSATAYLEGRTPTADELSQTEWWQTHSAKERQWLETSVTLGAREIERQRTDTKRQVTNAMLGLGLKDVNPKIIGMISVKMLTGQWSEEYANEQIRKLADPFAVGKLHQDIAALVNEDKMRTTRTEEDTVRDLAVRWLGPTMGVMAQKDVERWAGRFRNNPDAIVDFEEYLRTQRMAMFPGFENPNLTYEDIVQPIRNMVGNVWGRPAEDETMLVDLANLGDYSEVQKRLRKKGLDLGVQKVVNDSLDELSQSAIGEQVVRSTI